jgi:predicted nucleic acid-binding protein
MVTTAADPVFLDTNVLIYLRQALSPFHANAVAKLAALSAAGHELWVSRQVLREYLASMSRPGVLTGIVPMGALVNDVRAFAGAYRMAEDGPAITTELLTLLTTVTVAGKQVHDANIVATMLAHGVRRLLTHNVADFTRFASVITVEPLVP